MMRFLIRNKKPRLMKGGVTTKINYT